VRYCEPLNAWSCGHGQPSVGDPTDVRCRGREHHICGRRVIFPFVEPTIGELSFNVAEAVLSATIALRLMPRLFG